MPVCVITGSSGYLGTRLSKIFSDHHWAVIGMGRRKNQYESDHIDFDLDSGMPVSFPAKVDVLIHCAYNFRKFSWPEVYQSNVVRTLELFNNALVGGCNKRVFISSMAAYDQAKSLYGQAKYEAEEELQNHKTLIIRPGLIYEDRAYGLVGMMQKFIASFPVVPMIGNGNYKIYLAHIDDLCQAIFDLCTSNDEVPEQPVVLANPTHTTLRKIVEVFAHQMHKKALIIPIPPVFILMGLKFLEKIGLKVGFRSDSVLGIINTNPDPWQGCSLKFQFPFRMLND